MFRYRSTVRMRETDATQNIYFTTLLEKGVEAFEELLKVKGIGYFPMPIVNVEANFLAPVRLGDELEIHITVAKVGTTSFTLSYDFILVESDVVAGNASITHVVVSGEKAGAIPEKLVSLLNNQ